MELRPWLITVLSLLGFILALWGIERLISVHAIGRRDDPSDRGKARRRSAAGAAFALQQVFEPGLEHVVRVQQDQPEDEDDSSGRGNRDEPIDTRLADVLACLRDTPVDPEAIRRHLAAARREGLDWHALYETAVRLELADRPYRAPFLPPVSKVTPL